MATTELTSRASPSWLNKGSMPFLWIILTPIVTVPLSIILFLLLAGYQEEKDIFAQPSCILYCTPNDYLAVNGTIAAFALPGLVNLVPFVWVVSRNTRARLAGIVAGLLGLARLIIPAVLLILSFDRVTGDDGTSYFLVSNPILPWTAHIGVWLYGFLAWIGTLLVWASFANISHVNEELTGNTDHGKEGV